MTETKNNQQNAFTAVTCFTKTDSRQQQLLNKACSMLPEEVIDFFLKNPILFSGEIEENKAEIIRFSKEYKKHRFIVHLHSRLWSMTDDEIMYCILTQIAHCYLGNEPGFWSWKQNQDHSST